MPLFIVIEGLDGSGKSTLAKELANRLGAEHMQTPLKKGPSNKFGISSIMRERMDDLVSVDPNARVLFYASLVLVAQRHVTECLANGVNVICDRWLLSTLAYGQAMGANLNYVHSIPFLTRRPDLTIIVDTSLTVRRERIVARLIDQSVTPSDRWSMVTENNAKLEAAYNDPSLVSDVICGSVARLSGEEPVETVVERALAEVQWRL